MIVVHFDEAGTLAAGGRVSGLITWTPDNNKQPRGVKVALRWSTEGRGTTELRTVNEANLPIGPASSGVPVQVPFALDLPPDGPVTYNGGLLRIVWELLVEIDEPWAMNEKVRQEFTVVPR